MIRSAIISALVTTAALQPGAARAARPDAWVVDGDRGLLIEVERLNDTLATTRALTLVWRRGDASALATGVEGLDIITPGNLIVVINQQHAGRTESHLALVSVDHRDRDGRAVVDPFASVPIEPGERAIGVARDATTGQFAVLLTSAHGQPNRLVRHDSRGRPIASAVLRSPTGQPVRGATDLAFDPAGGLAVLDAAARSLLLFDPGADRARDGVVLDGLDGAALDAVAWDGKRGVWLVAQSRRGRLTLIRPSGAIERVVHLPDTDGRLSAVAVLRVPERRGYAAGESFDYAVAAGIVPVGARRLRSGGAIRSGAGGSSAGRPARRGDNPGAPPGDDTPGPGPTPGSPAPSPTPPPAPPIPPPGSPLPRPAPGPLGDPPIESPFGEVGVPIVAPLPGPGLAGGVLLLAVALRRPCRRDRLS